MSISIFNFYILKLAASTLGSSRPETIGCTGGSNPFHILQGGQRGGALPLIAYPPVCARRGA